MASAAAPEKEEAAPPPVEEGRFEAALATEDKEDSKAVLALLWLGFVVVHAAFLGLLEVAWIEFGLTVSFPLEVAYLVFLIILARGLGTTLRYRTFRSAVWILVCVLIFIVGVSVGMFTVWHIWPMFDRAEDIGDLGGMTMVFLIFAVVPMVLSALLLLVWSNVAGPVLAIYYGILLTVLLIREWVEGVPAENPGIAYTLANRETSDRIVVMGFVFVGYPEISMPYFAGTYALVVLVSLFVDPPQSILSLRPWIAGGSLLPLWILLHQYGHGGYFSLIDQAKNGDRAFIGYINFAIYAGLAFLQIICALLVEEFLPMVLAGASLIIVALEGSYMVGQLVFDAASNYLEPVCADGTPSCVASIAQLFTLALLGGMILLMTVGMVSKQDEIRSTVRAGKAKFTAKVLGPRGEAAANAEASEADQNPAPEHASV